MAKETKKEPELLAGDDSQAGTIDDPNVVDPYAHLRRDAGAPDLYRHETALEQAHEEAAAAEKASSDA